MAEETLRYRIEVDEASLQSELARARGTITNVLQTAVQTGAYAVNNIHADLALTRQVIAGPPAPSLGSPREELGFVGAALATAQAPTPPNMMTADFQAAAEGELRGRIRQATIGIGREAIPIATGIAGALGGRAMGARPIGTLATGAAGFLGGQLMSGMAFENIETRGTLEDIMQATRAPHPARPFTQGQRAEAARGIMQDIASDVRFGVEEASQLLAMGQSLDLFEGTRSVEEFRNKFRQMMEQVKTITRVFQQTTAEAMQTLGSMQQMGIAQPELVTGRMSDILTLSRMTGMRPEQTLQLGQAGAGMAQAQGIPMGTGFDAMMQNAMVASAMEAGRVVSPQAARQMGGVPGMAGLLTRFQQTAAAQFGRVLPAFANDAMTSIDRARVQEFVSGGISMEDLQMRAAERLADPAAQVRFASNRDLLQNQLATSNLAGPALFRMAGARAELTGARPEDVFGLMGQQMGFDPIQRSMILRATRDQGQFQQIADHQRQRAAFEIEMERRREESRLSSRISAGIEEVKETLANAIGVPIRTAGEFLGGVGEAIVTAPSRFLEAVDVRAGQLFGGPPPPTAMQMRGVTLADFAGRRMRGVSGEGRALGGRLRPMKDVRILSEEKQQEQYSNAIQSILNRAELAEHRVTQTMSDEEKDAFQEEALTTFAPDIAAVMNEEDPTRKNEMKEALRGRMSSWLRTNFGHLAETDAQGVQQFADTMLGLEGQAQIDETVKRGLNDAFKNATALQAEQFAAAELPAMMAMSAAGATQRERLITIGEQVGAAFRGAPDIASFRALKTLGERAIPLLGKGTALRERLEVAQKFIKGDFLRPGDMVLDTKELATVREQSLTSGQARFVDELIKTAGDTEGNKITADVLFRSVGQGLQAGFVPSHTPPPARSVDEAKQDLTAVTLDRLTGSVNNLSSASRELLTAAEKLTERTAGKL